MLKCVLTKVAAAAAVAVGGVGLGAYYETDGEILSVVGMDCGHTCPLSAMMSSSCGSAEATCPQTPSAGCCHAAEAAADPTTDSLGATLGGLAFAAPEQVPAPREAAVTPEPAAASVGAQLPQ